MLKLIRAEIYKLFHSWYLWAMMLGYFLLVSALIPDYIRRGYSYLNSSLYIGSFCIFMVMALAVVFLGNEFDHRVIQHYISAGNSRLAVFSAKVLVFSFFSIVMEFVTALIHGGLGCVLAKESMDLMTLVCLLPSYLAVSMAPVLFGFCFRDIGKTLAGGLILFLVMMASLNTAGVSDWAVYLPYGQTILASIGGFMDHLPLCIGIDLIWTAVLLIASYAVFVRADLK